METHISWHQDSKTKKPRHQDYGAKTLGHPETETIKPWHSDSTAEKPRHGDSKTKKPRHPVSVEFWPLCPLIDSSGIAACTTTNALFQITAFPSLNRTYHYTD